MIEHTTELFFRASVDRYLKDRGVSIAYVGTCDKDKIMVDLYLKMNGKYRPVSNVSKAYPLFHSDFLNAKYEDMYYKDIATLIINGQIDMFLKPEQFFILENGVTEIERR
jgi:hypothetical protein